MIYIGIGQMSLIMACLILAVILLRMSVKRKVKYQLILLIWQLLILRFMLPMAIPTGLPALNYISSLFTGQENVNDSETVLDQLLSGEGEGALTVTNEEDKKRILYAIWGVGSICVAVFFVSCYLKTKKFSDESIPIKNEQIEQWQRSQDKKVRVYVSDQISTPITMGIWQPKIVLPKSMKCSKKELEHILTHEMVHIQGKHLLWKRMMMLLLCIYWFNPLAWIMNDFLSKDIELACDERAIELLGKAEREFYALSLVKMAAEQTEWMMASGFSKNDIEERVRSIMRKNNKSKWITILALGMGVMSVSLSAATLDKSQIELKQTKQIKQVKGKQDEGDRIYEVKCGEHTIKRDDFTSTWWLDGKEVHILFDVNGHWHVNNRDEALENNIEIRILRNEDNEIIGVEDLTEDEIKELEGENKDFHRFLAQTK